MEFNGISIGSLVTANESQFVSLFQSRTQNAQEEFVNNFKSLQQSAIEETEVLKELSIKPSEVKDRLDRIVDKTKNVYQLSLINNVKLSSTKYGTSYVDVVEKGLFRVTGFNYFAKSPLSCNICEYAIFGAATFQIKNLHKEESIFISELELHKIKVHEYYSGEAMKICKVLNFIK